jgi:hypothetical protein
MITPRVRALLVVALGLGAFFVSASHTAAYNEENVKHIRMQRLDAVGCQAPIRLAATLTDSSGDPVAGAEVKFGFRKSAAGDTIGPTTASSDSAGRAGTVIDLSCVIGSRIIRASVTGDGAAQIVVTCSPRNGCNITPSGHALSEAAADATADGLLQQPANDRVRRLVSLLLVGMTWSDRVTSNSGRGRP